ncbi:MAG: NUDIX domain-containing protein [Candidatus Nanoarchaeia archaeon]|nr:NUDIX domain-containing protein [Candidatus Nanoarchaeia archaeon]
MREEIIIREGAGIIIENDKNEILMQLRDNNAKKFPNHWVLLGGGVEEGETPLDAIKRELMEEINLEIKNFVFFKNFIYKKSKQSFFYIKLNLDIEKIKLNEGEKIQYFKPDEIRELKIGFNIKKVLNNFFLNKKN